MALTGIPPTDRQTILGFVALDGLPSGVRILHDMVHGLTYLAAMEDQIMSQSDCPAPVIKPRPADVVSPDAIIGALYETISGPAGKRNWQRERSLFLPGARLVPIGKRIYGQSGLSVMTVDEWIEEVDPFFKENDFWETEVMRHSDRFGNMIQAFSTYEARDRKDGAPIARGINSIQLVYEGERWWVAGIMWDNESKDNPIPGEFTPYLW